MIAFKDICFVVELCQTYTEMSKYPPDLTLD